MYVKHETWYESDRNIEHLKNLCTTYFSVFFAQIKLKAKLLSEVFFNNSNRGTGNTSMDMK